ncbi:MAG: hypothetical protein KJO73_09665, partial [Croceitalea sp.]|nr:hypothetical protein [Croceitalea sp.]
MAISGAGTNPRTSYPVGTPLKNSVPFYDKPMRPIPYFFICAVFAFGVALGQEVYELDPHYPVHDLDPYLHVYADSTDQLSAQQLLTDTTLPYTLGDEVPKYLKTNMTYWGRLQLKATDSLTGWKLHFEDTMIGPPAWTKSNGKVDVYAYVDGQLHFHQKTGVEYPKNERATTDKWMLNSIDLSPLPVGQAVTLIIRAEGNSFGYPAYFNLSARSPGQAFYHEPYQFHSTFNIFMFGVTFIIFLHFFLQFMYLREPVYFWFSLWLFFCMLTQAMTIGLFIGAMPTIRYPFSMLISHGIFFTFWFFGRAFIDSKRKFPKLDKFILGLAFFSFIEIVVMAIYIIFFNPEVHFMAPTPIHFIMLNLYTIGSFILSIVLTLQKDLFARYFGVGSLIASIFLIMGTLWSLGIM